MTLTGSEAIPDYFCSNCSDLEPYIDKINKIDIGGSINTIGEYAFADFIALSSVTFSNFVKSILSRAFDGCSSLTSIVIPASINNLYGDSFDKKYLESITVDPSNPKYDSRDNCNAIIEKDTDTLIFGISNTVIPNSVTAIGDEAFEECPFEYIDIPDSVVSIGEDAFARSSLREITIPNSVTTIGEYAFANCNSLNFIEFSNSIETIPNSVCSDCFYLCAIVIPDSVTTIGNYAFSYCESALNIVIPNSVTTIGEYAFSGCHLVKTIVLPDSLETIGEGAFNGCTRVSSIVIPKNVSSIGVSAFHSSVLTSIKVDSNNTTYDSRNNCNAIIETSTDTLILGCKNTVIPNGIKIIGEKAFQNCGGLTSISIPDSVTSIGEEAFIDCGFKSVIIPDSVEMIEKLAFAECESLLFIYIPNSVETINACECYYSPFINCHNLAIYTNASSPLPGWGEYWNYCDENEDSYVPVAYNYDIEEALKQSEYWLNLDKTKTSIVIPNYITFIPDGAFMDCVKLVSITMPNTITSIGNNAFYNCKSLKSITIPSSVTSIANSAFFYCSSLTSIKVDPENTVYDSRNDCNGIIKTNDNELAIAFKNTTIPEGVIKIGDHAYDHVDSFSISIPASVTEIGYYAFRDSTNRLYISVDPDNTKYTSSNNDNVLIEKDTKTLVLGSKNSTIPNDSDIVDTIGRNAFKYCNNLLSIKIPNSITTICNDAFNGCENMIGVFIPSTVTTIEDCAFGDCYNLTIYSDASDKVPTWDEEWNDNGDNYLPVYI